jgi:acyl-CoA thioesterase I
MLRLLLSALVLLPVLARAEQPVVLVLGDSLSAGYGLPQGRGWVSLLAQRIGEKGYPYRVINASVSGDTTAGGLTRLPPLLERERPAVLVIELGANDGLRGVRFGEIESNLTRLVQLGRAAGSRVLLIGVRLPPNYGTVYTERFQGVFRKVAEREKVPLVPRLLAGVAEDWNLMQPDGLHPVAKAQSQLLDNVWPTLRPLLETRAQGAGKSSPSANGQGKVR